MITITDLLVTCIIDGLAGDTRDDADKDTVCVSRRRLNEHLISTVLLCSSEHLPFCIGCFYMIAFSKLGVTRLRRLAFYCLGPTAVIMLMEML